MLKVAGEPIVLTVGNAEELVMAIRDLLTGKKFTAVGVGLKPGGKTDPWVITGNSFDPDDDIRVHPVESGVILHIYPRQSDWTIPTTRKDEGDLDGHAPTLLFDEDQVYIRMRDPKDDDRESTIVLAVER